MIFIIAEIFILNKLQLGIDDRGSDNQKNGDGELNNNQYISENRSF